MKVIIVFAALVAVALSQADKDAVVVRYDSENIGVDGYQYNYETSNGIGASENAQLVNPGSENEGISVRGQYSYTGDDGVRYAVNYVADENGFQPEAAHIPRA